MQLFILFFLAYSLLFVVVDGMQRLLIKKNKWSRKATHIGAGVVSFYLPLYMERMEIFILATIFLIILTISRRHKILTLHNVDRYTLGEILYPLSIMFLALICLPRSIESFQLAVLILAFSDGLAGAIGQRLNYYPVHFLKCTKSVGGAITFFIVTLLIFSYLYGFSASTLLLIVGLSTIFTVIEFILPFGTDNLVLPLLVAYTDMFIVSSGLLVR